MSNQKQVLGIGTSKGPNACIVGGNESIYIVWRDESTGTIWWLYTDLNEPVTSWSSSAKNSGISTLDSPAIALCSGVPYIAYTATAKGGGKAIYWCKIINGGFTTPEKLVGATSASAPAIITTGSLSNVLYVAYRDESDKLYWTLYNGTTWSNPIQQGETNSTPALATDGNERIFIAWKDKNNGNIWWASNDAPGGWGPSNQVTPHGGQALTSVGPAIYYRFDTSSGAILTVVWKGENSDNIYYSISNDIYSPNNSFPWNPVTRLDGDETSDRPAIVLSGDQSAPYLFWKGAGSGIYFWCPWGWPTFFSLV